MRTARAEVAPMTRARTSSGAMLAIGLWLVLAPHLLGYADAGPALWNDRVAGLWLVVVAGLRTIQPGRRKGLGWTNLFLGLWLIAAPFVLNYRVFDTFTNTAGAFWNDMACGVLVVMLSLAGGVATRARRGRGPPIR